MAITGTITTLSSGYFDGEFFVNDGKYYMEIKVDENPGAVLGRKVRVLIDNERV